jgi:hypothetical protein
VYTFFWAPLYGTYCPFTTNNTKILDFFYISRGISDVSFVLGIDSRNVLVGGRGVEKMWSRLDVPTVKVLTLAII